MLVDITVLLSHIKNVGWKFYPTIIFLVAKVVNRHPEFRMAMKDNELVIWNEIHPNYTIFHNETETFFIIMEPLRCDIQHFQKTYSEDMARYGDNLAYWPKEESRENIFFISGIPWVSFTSFSVSVANMKNFFCPYVYAWKILRARGRVLYLSPFRYIILSAMVSMWQGFLMSYKRSAMRYHSRPGNRNDDVAIRPL